MDSNSESVINMETTSKRVARCTGCKTPIDDHHWGIPSRFCDGFEKCSPKREVKGASPLEEEDVMATLTEELKALELEEQAIRRQQREERPRKDCREKAGNRSIASKQPFTDCG